MTTYRLPQFDLNHGYLPPGVHSANHLQIRDLCVDSMKWSYGHRQKLFFGYERLVAALQLVGIPTKQWIGGSFVSTEEAPEDIDLVNFCDVSAYQTLSPEIKAMIGRYFKGEETAKHCCCDSYFVPLPPIEHQLKDDFMIVQDYWENELGRDTQGRQKGIISRLVEQPETNETDESNDAAPA